MSTDYRTSVTILFADIFDGRLEAFGIREHVTPASTEHPRSLTDGENFIHAYANADSTLSTFTRYAGNIADKILGVIVDVFDTIIYSAYEPEFWGFSSMREWECAIAKLNEEHDIEFHGEILKYIRGEPNTIGAGTIGIALADIAKELTLHNPALMLPDNRERLLDAIDGIYSVSSLSPSL